MADPVSNHRSMPLAIQSREAARVIGVSERTLWTLTNTGRIRCIRVGVGPKARKLYPVAELHRFLAEQPQTTN